MRAIKIYSLYFLQFLKARLEYKADFIASLLASIVISITGLLFVSFLIDGETVRSLGGWTRDEVMFVYGYSFLATAFFSTVAPNLYQFGDKYVIQGQFDRVLLRPLNSLCQVLFETFNVESLGNFAVGIAVILTVKGNLGLHFSPLDFLWLIVSSLSGAIILLSVFITVSSLSFHFEDRLGVSAPVFNLINFGRYPVSIFNRVIQFILSWVVPFAFVAFYPATHFFSRKGYEVFCYSTPLVAAISLGVAILAWQFGVSRYSSAGN